MSRNGGEDSEWAAARLSTAQFYELHGREYALRTLEADMSEQYDTFASFLREPRRVLDAGCGSGRDLKEFRRRGFKAMGIDASVELCRIAESYSGCRCQVRRLEDLDFEAEFDGVWACASLLHLPRPLAEETIRRFYRALVPDGILYASVQLGQGESIAADGRFFSFYSESDFAGMVKGAGFRLEDVRVTADRLNRPSSVRWVNVVARRPTAESDAQAQ